MFSGSGWVCHFPWQKIFRVRATSSDRVVTPPDLFVESWQFLLIHSSDQNSSTQYLAISSFIQMSQTTSGFLQSSQPENLAARFPGIHTKKPEGATKQSDTGCRGQQDIACNNDSGTYQEILPTLVWNTVL
jgi:hypothetical protein